MLSGVRRSILLEVGGAWDRAVESAVSQCVDAWMLVDAVGWWARRLCVGKATARGNGRQRCQRACNRKKQHATKVRINCLPPTTGLGSIESPQ